MSTLPCGLAQGCASKQSLRLLYGCLCKGQTEHKGTHFLSPRKSHQRMDALGEEGFRRQRLWLPVCSFPSQAVFLKHGARTTCPVSPGLLAAIQILGPSSKLTEPVSGSSRGLQIFHRPPGGPLCSWQGENHNPDRGSWPLLLTICDLRRVNTCM